MSVSSGMQFVYMTNGRFYATTGWSFDQLDVLSWPITPDAIPLAEGFARWALG